MRDAFNFYISYARVASRLSNKDRLAFYDALIARQFTGKEPENLPDMAMFAYESQRHSIDKQVVGYERAKNVVLSQTELPLGLPTKGNPPPPLKQVQGEVKGEGEYSTPVYKAFDHLSISVDEFNKIVAEGYTEEQVNNILADIQNYAKNNTYKSLYLTALKWLKRDKEKNATQLPKMPERQVWKEMPQ